MWILNAIAIIAAILTGISINNRKLAATRKPVPKLMWDVIAGIQKKVLVNTSPTHSPLFGERPHYFMPPSDVEQYRIRGSKKRIKSLLYGDEHDDSHYYIPYPNDPPHTFPAIKARKLFTKSPKNLREVYIPECDPVERQNLRRGAKLKVPLSQLEERYRTVYSNAQRNNLEITVNAMTDLRDFEKLGYQHTKVYDFHNVDGLLSPNLEDTSKKEPIIEEL